MSHSSHSVGHIKNVDLTSLEARLTSLEAQVSNSWATQTRDEYEKAIKTNLKQEIMTFLTRAVIAATLFVLGVGSVGLNLVLTAKTSQFFADRGNSLSQEILNNADAEIDKEQKEDKWSRFHNLGLQFRYLAENYEELYEGARIPEEEKLKFYERAFHLAEDNYTTALSMDSKKAETYYERAQLHYKLAKRFKLADWKDNTQAFDDYRRAAENCSPKDIERGWRADSYIEMGMIQLEWALSSNLNLTEKHTYLTRSYEYLSKAKDEYERAERSRSVDAGLANTKELLAYFQPDGSFSEHYDFKKLSDLLASPL